jgi:hypothetical protein
MAPLGTGGVGPELTACLIVDIIGPAATATIQGYAAINTQHEALVTLAALEAGALTYSWCHEGCWGWAAGWAGWATELIVAVVRAGHLCG